MERENVALCTACMGPYTPFEKRLTRLWQLTPDSLAQPLLPITEKIVGKKADFVHASTSIQHRLNYLPQWLPQIKHIIAPSTHMRNMFVLNGFPAERIIISPYGVQPPAPGFIKTPSTKLRFGFIGRVTSIKGVHLLLEAFAQLSRSERTELTIYGKADVKSDPYMRALQRQAERLPNVKFASFVANTHLNEIYRYLDVLVVPSIWPENSPITILEALAHGIPIIASDVPGIADLVQHEVNGLIFASRNVQDLGAQMSRCFDSSELVSRLAAQCHLVKSLPEDANSLIKLYEEVLAAKL
jgi:glycosyltransferase involved in cell wall biosynthesis